MSFPGKIRKWGSVSRVGVWAPGRPVRANGRSDGLGRVTKNRSGRRVGAAGDGRARSGRNRGRKGPENAKIAISKPTFHFLVGGRTRGPSLRQNHPRRLSALVGGRTRGPHRFDRTARCNFLPGQKVDIWGLGRPGRANGRSYGLWSVTTDRSRRKMGLAGDGRAQSGRIRGRMGPKNAKIAIFFAYQAPSASEVSRSVA